MEVLARRLKFIYFVLLWLFCLFVSPNSRGKTVQSSRFIAHRVHGNHAGIVAARCSNGFPDRVVSRVLFNQTGPATRIIPEMNFTCNGTIVGFTMAALQQSGEKYPLIQVWRKNMSQPGSYFKTGVDIAIGDVLCAEVVTEVSNRVILYCKLNETYQQVSVQPGDILGLELPSVNEDDIIPAFARVSRGPTNYMFDQQFISSPVVLSNATLVNFYLPQIAMKIKSGSSNVSSFNSYKNSF